MNTILSAHPEYSERILPYIGGQELNSLPKPEPYRYAIYLSDCETEADAGKYTELLNIVREKVKPERERLGNNPNNIPLKKRWWAYQAHRPRLYSRLSRLEGAICHAQVGPHLCFSILPANWMFSQQMIVIADDRIELLGTLQCRAHETWTRLLASSMKDDLRYTPSDCFKTFPMVDSDTMSGLIPISSDYFSFRSEVLASQKKGGLTKTYNRFHDRGQNAPDIIRLRELHAELDAAVLRTYGWEDLADQAHPEFIEQDADDGKQAKTRLDWPSEFKDEVLARLLALNAERRRGEVAAGLIAADGTIIREDGAFDEDEDDVDEEVEEA